jgi:ribosomal protein S18 acetylase RimI-like enzyme
MKTTTRIGLIGDWDPAVTAHQAIPVALRLASGIVGVSVEHEWVPTEEILDATRVAGFDALWCVPASPYRSTEGALTAIRFAREQRRPFLGTCGGFQHAILEHARNVLGWADAEHAETAPEAARPVITALSCSLVEATGTVRLVPGSRIASCYGRAETTEGYRCRFGIAPEVEAAIVSGPLRVGARDAEGEIRAVELDGHPFFLATLFQPERAALRGEAPPVVVALVRAAADAVAGAIAVVRARLSSPVGQTLIAELNAELAGVYPEPGANHFALDAEEVGPGRGAFLVAFRDGAPIACGAVRRLDGRTGEIKRMYVAPHARGLGLGRRLVEELEREARALGLRRLVLETGTRQDAAIGLYRATGFERIPLYGEYLASPDTSLCFGKELAALEVRGV